MSIATISPGSIAALEAVAGDEAALVRIAAEHFETSELAFALMTAADVVQKTRVLWVNPAFARLTGYASSNIVGRSTELLAGAHLDVIHAKEIDLLRDHREHARFGVVATKQRPDQTWYDVEEQLIPIHGSPNVVTHHLLVQRRLPIA